MWATRKKLMTASAMQSHCLFPKRLSARQRFPRLTCVRGWTNFYASLADARSRSNRAVPIMRAPTALTSFVDFVELCEQSEKEVTPVDLILHTGEGHLVTRHEGGGTP